VHSLLLIKHIACVFVFLKVKLLISVACSFLCLVPDEAKSSYHVEGTGYDTYLRDAHRQVRLVLQYD